MIKKNKKSAINLLEAKVMVDPRCDILIDNLLNRWASVNYGQLSVLLAQTRFLYMLHQFNHWTVKGDNSYSDHLLFQRLYETINEEIDTIAEKVVGLGNNDNVDLLFQIQTINVIAKIGCESNITMPSVANLAKISLSGEYTYLNVIEKVKQDLDVNGLLTYGLDNLLAGLADTHEGHIFLLKQRVD